jgi:hypothetical protein
MKKPKPGAARLAGKRAAKRVSRAKAQGIPSMSLDFAIGDLISEWLAAKPEEERIELEGRSRSELIRLIDEDAAWFDLPAEHPC